MGEQVEHFRAAHKIDQQERAERREVALRTLRQHDVGFVAWNDGAHLLVRGRVDYWPGRGRWRARDTREEGRGVWSLLRFLGLPVDDAAIRAEREGW